MDSDAERNGIEDKAPIKSKTTASRAISGAEIAKQNQLRGQNRKAQKIKQQKKGGYTEKQEEEERKRERNEDLSCV